MLPIYVAGRGKASKREVRGIVTGMDAARPKLRARASRRLKEPRAGDRRSPSPRAIDAKLRFAIPQVHEREGPRVAFPRGRERPRVAAQDHVRVLNQEPALTGFAGAPRPEFGPRGTLVAPRDFAAGAL